MYAAILKAHSVIKRILAYLIVEPTPKSKFLWLLDSTDPEL